MTLWYAACAEEYDAHSELQVEVQMMNSDNDWLWVKDKRGQFSVREIRINWDTLPETTLHDLLATVCQGIANTDLFEV